MYECTRIKEDEADRTDLLRAAGSNSHEKGNANVERESPVNKAMMKPRQFSQHDAHKLHACGLGSSQGGG